MATILAHLRFSVTALPQPSVLPADFSNFVDRRACWLLGGLYLLAYNVPENGSDHAYIKLRICFA